ncbi:Carbonic anhydrase family protein [Rubrivivax sp. A210]|uniref:carbonic anhydrase n=1 Tax=Rubrivivax sp. A210 TaxID=2772301 RepID=UPI0019181298|nr:carbonic anhydrase family protein [Rubrivivax sp. A210]CAD5370569.1 Carbonic anhydrase family protein [Rubrivivax sp. A210]
MARAHLNLICAAALLGPLGALAADPGAAHGAAAPAVNKAAQRPEPKVAARPEAHAETVLPNRGLKTVRAGSSLEAVAPPVAGVSPSDADAIDQLRARLAEKLAARTLAANQPGELRVAPRAVPPPAHRPRAAAAAGHGTAAASLKAAEATGHGAAHWGYNGPAGPQTWGGLKPEFALCSNGQRQSPIDIRGGLAVDLEPVKFDYQPSRFGVIDNGHTVQVNVPPGNAIEVGPRRFELLQFHFHRPSEERIDGRQFEMSLHMVHKDPEGRLAVVAVLFDKGQSHGLLQRVWSNLPLERNEESQARVTLDANELLPADRRYFTYMGSLTTPPCTEGVQWVVMRQPVTASAEQIDLFARIYPMNARPVQSAAGRRILQSN